MIFNQYKQLMGELSCYSFGRDYVILSSNQINSLKKEYPIGWLIYTIKRKIELMRANKNKIKYFNQLKVVYDKNSNDNGISER